MLNVRERKERERLGKEKEREKALKEQEQGKMERDIHSVLLLLCVGEKMRKRGGRGVK